MNKKYIVKYVDNYADEFDINEFSLATEEELEDSFVKIFMQFNELGWSLEEVNVEDYEGDLEFIKTCGYHTKEAIANFEKARELYLANKKILDNLDDFYFDYCVGTNEYIEYEGEYGFEKLISKLEIIEATEDKINALQEADILESYSVIQRLVDINKRKS